MAIDDRLRILADGAKYDASCASSGTTRAGVAGGLGHTDGTGICHSYTPGGRRVSQTLTTRWSRSRTWRAAPAPHATVTLRGPDPNLRGPGPNRGLTPTCGRAVQIGA